MSSISSPDERAVSGRTRVSALLWVVLAASMFWSHRSVLEVSLGPARPDEALDAALFDPAVTSPLLGLAVFFALLFMRRQAVARNLWAPCDPWIAWSGLAGGAALLLWSRAIRAPDLELPALVLELLGGAAWLGGRGLVRAIGVPVLALVCVIPLPAILLNELLFPLQLGTVAWTSTLLSLCGRAHEVAGDLILTRGIVFQVIEGCSGLKTILSLMLAALVYAEGVGRRGLEKLWILAIAPVVGFFVNGLRVLVLVFREVPADSAEHQAYGLLAIGVGVVLIAAIELGLSRTLFWKEPGAGDAGAGASARAGQPAGARGGRRLLGWVAVSLVLSGCVALALPGALPGRKIRLANIEALPLELAGRTARGVPVDDAFLGSVRFAHRLHRAYEKPGEAAIRVFVGLADPERRDISALSPKTAIPRSGWLALERIEPLARDDGAGLERERLMIRYDPRRPGSGGMREVLVEHLRMGFAPWEVELFRAWLGLDRIGAPLDARELVLRVETDVDADRAAAELRLRQFVQEVVDWYRSGG
jgi:exosortase